MPINNFNGYFELGRVNQIEIMPIKAFTLEPTEESTEDGLIVVMVEAGSNWKLTPITLPNDIGGEETQGYNLEITLILPFAEYSDTERIIKYYQNNPTHIGSFNLWFSQAGEFYRGLFLSGLDYQSPLNSFPVNQKLMGLTGEFSMTLDIEPVDMRNRTKILIRKFFEVSEDYASTLTNI